MDIVKIDKVRKTKKIRKIFSIFFFIVVAVIVVSITVYSLLTSKFSELSHTVKYLSTPETFPIISKQHSLTQIERLDNSMVVLSKASVLFYDYKGNIINEYLHGYTNPVLKTKGQYVIVYDRGGFNYKLLTPFKECYEQTMEEKIITANISNDGNVGVAVFDNQYSTLLNVYDKSAKPIYKWFSAQEKVIDFTFSDNNQKLAVAAVIPSSGIISTIVYELDINSEKENYKLELANNTPYSIKYKGNLVTLITDNTVTTINNAGKIVLSYMINSEIISFVNNDKNTYLTVNSYLSNNHTLVVLNRDGKETNTIDLDTKQTSIYYDNGLIYYINSENFFSVNPSKGIINNGNLAGEYLDFIVHNGNCYLLNNNSIEKSSENKE